MAKPDAPRSSTGSYYESSRDDAAYDETDPATRRDSDSSAYATFYAHAIAGSNETGKGVLAPDFNHLLLTPSYGVDSKMVPVVGQPGQLVNDHITRFRKNNLLAGRKLLDGFNLFPGLRNISRLRFAFPVVDDFGKQRQ